MSQFKPVCFKKENLSFLVKRSLLIFRLNLTNPYRHAIILSLVR